MRQYNRMRVLNISPTELRLEILEVIEDSDTMHQITVRGAKSIPNQ